MTSDRTEILILRTLLHDEEYSRKVLPFLKPEYFTERDERVIYDCISTFYTKYNKQPTVESLLIDLSKRDNLSETEFKSIRDIIKSFKTHDKLETRWLLDNTEEFCKEKALYNGIMESIQIIDGKSKDKTKTAIPSILSTALAVSFDTHIGHDFIEDADKRYNFYHTVEKRIPFDIDLLNKITNNGTPYKTLNVCLAGTGVGKSLFLCHHAANCLMQGKNVLYITCEMAEERIAERIDANLMDTSLDDLKALPKDIYDRKLKRIMDQTTGKLIIKEYPTATASVMHFKHLLDELRLKRNFTPEIIFIDYLNICASSRMKQSATVNSYTFIKAIAEELRGLAVETGVPIFTATQTNRQGFSSTDVELTDTSESFGLPQTADFMFALVSTEELQGLGQIMIKQLKNRYADPASNRRFVVGIDRSKMKLFDLDESAQRGIINMPEVKDEDEEDAGEFKSFRERMNDKFKKRDFADWS
jgi:replicative DNA helicase